MTIQSARAVVVTDPLIESDSYDYADAFEIEIPQADTRSPEQLFRDASGGGPQVLRWVPFVHQWVLRFRLGPASSPNHIFGWRIVTSEPDVIRIEADGPLMRGVIVGRRDSTSTAVLTTYIFYVRRAQARVIWALVGPLHRRVAPRLLQRARQVPNVSWLRKCGAGISQCAHARRIRPYFSSDDDSPSSRRATTNCWICCVPSKMSRILESRAHFSSSVCSE